MPSSCKRSYYILIADDRSVALHWESIINKHAMLDLQVMHSLLQSLCPCSKSIYSNLVRYQTKYNKRSIIAQNVDKIRCKWKIRGNIADIAKMKDKCAIYRDNKDGFVSRTQMVKELRGALQGGTEIRKKRSSQGGYW